MQEICFLSNEEFRISLAQLCQTAVCRPGKLHFNSAPVLFVKGQINFISKMLHEAIFCGAQASDEIYF